MAIIVKSGGLYYTKTGDIAHIMLADNISISGNVYLVGGGVWRVYWNIDGTPIRTSEIGKVGYTSGTDKTVPDFTLTDDFCGDKDTAKMVIKMTKMHSTI
jgi:hypothetical protein